MRLLVAVLLVIAATSLTAQNVRPVRFDGGLTWTFGIDADAFFRDYQIVFGGKSSSFDVPTGFSASLSTYQLGQASIGLTAGYYRAVMRENYDYRPALTDTSFGPPQNATQNMALTCLPALLTIDFFPFQRQFTGFVGAGVGVGFVSFLWTEELTASQAPGARSSGTRYDDSHIVPAVSARAGVSLGLDDELGSNVRAAITLEGGYLYLPLTAPLMAQASESFATRTPARLQGDYAVQAGGFQLRLGFTVFIVPRKSWR